MKSIITALIMIAAATAFAGKGKMHKKKEAAKAGVEKHAPAHGTPAAAPAQGEKKAADKATH